MAPRDPITSPTSSSNAKTKNVSAGRIKSISGGGPNFTKGADAGKGFPSTASPYKGK
jgi:hypothetical protein